ncbi:MAG TPA: DUF255 domain-containing protein, partial [Chitinophagaceae bacterium]|nr:DUF255 domain-containing protein [Chitinophagaceae bacterium]
MHKITVSIILFSCLFISAARPVRTLPAPKLQWMTMKEAEQAMLKEKRPILIDLYTSWCGWCKVMDRKTYSNPKVIAYLQEHFYPVKINAETKETISFNQKEYQYNDRNRANDFAIFL